MIVNGISVMLPQLIARNSAIELVAVSLTGLSVCSSSMALSPIGVAALSRPSILAEKFMQHRALCRMAIGHFRKQPSHQWPHGPRKGIDQARILGDIQQSQPQRHDSD